MVVAAWALLQRAIVAALDFHAALEELTAVLRSPSASVPDMEREVHAGIQPDAATLAAASTLCSAYRPTPREAEVLALAAAGWTNVRIGRRLGISERTVRKHLSSVYEHSGQQGRSAAMAWWTRRNGLD